MVCLGFEPATIPRSYGGCYAHFKLDTSIGVTYLLNTSGTKYAQNVEYQK